MTVYIGESLKNLQLQGHVYIFDEHYDMPLRKSRKSERRIVADGREAVGSEYWGINGSCGRAR